MCLQCLLLCPLSLINVSVDSLVISFGDFSFYHVFILAWSVSHSPAGSIQLLLSFQCLPNLQWSLFVHGLKKSACHSRASTWLSLTPIWLWRNMRYSFLTKYSWYQLIFMFFMLKFPYFASTAALVRLSPSLFTCGSYYTEGADISFQL